MIDFDPIAWHDEDDPRGTVQHIAANELTIEEVEQVLYDPANRPTVNRSRGRPAVFGRTEAVSPIPLLLGSDRSRR